MRRTVIFSLVCAMLAVAAAVWGFSGTGEAPKAPPISGALLLVEDDTGTYLMQLRKGLQEAVQERSGTLIVERLADHDPEKLSYSSIDAVYLLSDSPEAHLPALREKDIPVIVLGMEVRGEICVLPDEEAGGRLLGGHLAGLLSDGGLVIVGGRESSLEALRLKGVEAGLGGASYTLVSPGDLMEAGNERPAAVLTLSDEGIETALALCRQDGPPLYGFDAADIRLPLMEAGRLEGVAADDPYALGYIAGSLLDDIRGKDAKPFVRLSPRRLVTRGTMYDAANVKLMFPLLH